MSHRSFPLTALALAVLAGFVAACGDDPTRPDVLAELVEADAIARSAHELPGLGDFLTAATASDPGQRAGLVRARELWIAGTTADDGLGGDRRRLAATHAAPILAATVSAESWADIRVRIDRWIGTADRMLVHMELPGVHDRLADARRHLDRADAATDTESRVYHTVLAVADLVETTPRHVARTTVADARAAVARAEDRSEARNADGPDRASLARARRLVDWATRAMEEEEHVRAIQRAYYAIQLVEDR